jgi:hypothetical protein
MTNRTSWTDITKQDFIGFHKTDNTFELYFIRLVHLFSYWMAREQLSPHWTEEGDGGKLVIEHIFPVYDPDT